MVQQFRPAQLDLSGKIVRAGMPGGWGVTRWGLLACAPRMWHGGVIDVRGCLPIGCRRGGESNRMGLFAAPRAAVARGDAAVLEEGGVYAEMPAGGRESDLSRWRTYPARSRASLRPLRGNHPPRITHMRVKEAE